MALYAIGDLHLSLGVEKPMDVFGGNWVGYMDKLTEHSIVITKSQGLELLRKRGYIFKDEVEPAPA